MNALAAFGYDLSAARLVLAFFYLIAIGAVVTSAGLYLAHRLLRSFGDPGARGRR